MNTISPDWKLEPLLAKFLFREGIDGIIPYRVRLSRTPRVQVTIDILLFVFTSAVVLGTGPLPLCLPYLALFWIVTVVGGSIAFHRKKVHRDRMEPHRFLLERVDSPFGRRCILIAVLCRSVFHLLYYQSMQRTVMFTLFNLLLYWLFVRIILTGMRRLEEWEEVDWVLRYSKALIIQILTTIRRWSLLIAPTVLIGAVASFISAELWLAVNQAPIKALTIFCTVLVLGGVLVALNRAQGSIKQLVDQSSCAPSSDVAKCCFTALMGWDENKRDSLIMWRKLRELAARSTWKLNEFILTELKVKLVQEYILRSAISLVISTVLAMIITFFLATVFLMASMRESVLLRWSYVDPQDFETKRLVWAINQDTSLESELESFFSNWYKPDVFANEPVPRVALLGSSFLVPLLLIQTASSPSTLCKLMGLTNDKVSEHVAVGLYYRWCVEPDFQELRSSLPIFVAARWFVSGGRGWNLNYNYRVIVFEKDLPIVRMRLIARQILENQFEPHCILFMSLATYLTEFYAASYLPRFVKYGRALDLPSSAWYEFAIHHDGNLASSTDSMCWIWDPHRGKLVKFEKLESAVEYVGSTDYHRY